MICNRAHFWGVTDQNGLRNLKYPTFIPKSLKVLAKEQPDIIHHHVALPVAVFSARLKGKIIYEAVEFYISQSLENYLPTTFSKNRYLFRRITCALCRRCILYSFTANKLFKTYAMNNSVVREIFNVPVLESNIDNDLYNDLKARYANRKVLVYAGAISNEKGVMNIVRAINNVRIQHHDVKLLLIGSAKGDDTEILNKYIIENNIKEYVDIISFQPYSKLFTYYCIADIGIGLIQKIIASKFTKGGSRKLMEYMKASLALLVTNDGDIGIIVKEEECGILVDIWDEAELRIKLVDA